MLVLFINSEATIKKTKKNCYCRDLLFSFVRIDNKLIFILIMDIQNIFIKCVNELSFVELQSDAG